MRARPNTAADMPTMTMPAAKLATPGASKASSMPSAPHSDAPTMARRSPQRVVTSDAGRLLASAPRPSRVTTSAAIETEPPSARTASGTAGRMAPSPRPNSSEGPKAATAIFLRLNGCTATRRR